MSDVASASFDIIRVSALTICSISSNEQVDARNLDGFNSWNDLRDGDDVVVGQDSPVNREVELEERALWQE